MTVTAVMSLFEINTFILQMFFFFKFRYIQFYFVIWLWTEPKLNISYLEAQWCCS